LAIGVFPRLTSEAAGSVQGSADEFNGGDCAIDAIISAFPAKHGHHIGAACITARSAREPWKQT
jgi:hypothetical protein